MHLDLRPTYLLSRAFSHPDSPNRPPHTVYSRLLASLTSQVIDLLYIASSRLPSIMVSTFSSTPRPLPPRLAYPYGNSTAGLMRWQSAFTRCLAIQLESVRCSYGRTSWPSFESHISVAVLLNSCKFQERWYRRASIHMNGLRYAVPETPRRHPIS